MFEGTTYDRDNDRERLTGQLERVKRLMADGAWRTLREIADAIGGASEAGVSARLRDLRKPRFGRHTVERRRRSFANRGIHEYKLTLRKVRPLGRGED